MRKLILWALLLGGCQTLKAPAPQGVEIQGYTAWLGVEYAQADRWHLPERGPDWVPTGAFTTMGSSCPQRGQAQMVEDCLFLNVFAPAQADDLPVLVWIHGGGFVSNEGGDYVKSLTRDGIVAVSFNYRLGMLGFHDWAGWDETDPRNFAQADMVMALEWVQANIKKFGGDPDRVTIMGHSAGGTGVQLMMTDPRAKGLFDQAIAHSGYAAWPFQPAYNPSDEERTRIRYGALEVDVPAQDLVERVSAFHLPFIGGSDLAAQPLDLFKSGQSGSVPYLTGANSHDGLGTLQAAGFENKSFLESFAQTKAVRAAYAADFEESNALAAERIFGDIRYGFSARETARAHEGPAALFLLDAPGAGHNHIEHYDYLFGPEPSRFRTMIVDFIKTGTHDGLSRDAWLVLNKDGTMGEAGNLDQRLDALTSVEFPKP